MTATAQSSAHGHVLAGVHGGTARKEGMAQYGKTAPTELLWTGFVMEAA